MNAKSVDICVFTNIPPNGGYGHDVIAQPERGMYAAASDAASQLFQQEGLEGTTVALCYAQDPNAQNFLKQTTVQPPFIAIAGTFPDGTMKLYALKTTSNVKGYIRAMWLGEFGGNTPMPTNLGDGDGGWGEGSSVVCKIFPPLCALGFLPWLVLAGVATYQTVESRSTLGKAVWGVPAALLWLGFFERGGVKQIQWWMKKL